MNVYIVQGISGGPIKIGKSTRLNTRLEQLQVGYHEKLEFVLKIYDCPESLEKYLHTYYDSFRLHGEWFNPVILDRSQELVDTIKDCFYRYPNAFNWSCAKLRWYSN